MSIFAQGNNLLDQQQQRANYVQGGPPGAQQQPGMMSSMLSAAKPAMAKAALGSAAGTAATAAMGPLGFLAAPMLSGIMGSLFANGTTSVPGGYADGTEDAQFGADPLAGGGAPMQAPRGPMGPMGTDTVSAMLTPGEAVIPAGAAQNPANQQAIQSMVQEGAQKNAMAPNGQGAMLSQMPMGPMAAQGNAPAKSGKAQREELKQLQDMSLKKKSWEAEEQRKQQLHQLKMQQLQQQAMQQSQQRQE